MGKMGKGESKLFECRLVVEGLVVKTALFLGGGGAGGASGSSRGVV